MVNIINKRDMKKKILKCLSASNRWKHLVGGVLIGLGADSWYCACYTGAGVGAALELKDIQRGCSWDWIDFAQIVGGAVVGHLIRVLL